MEVGEKSLLTLWTLDDIHTVFTFHHEHELRRRSTKKSQTMWMYSPVLLRLLTPREDKLCEQCCGIESHTQCSHPERYYSLLMRFCMEIMD